MAVELRGSVHLPVPIERAWQLWTDAARYPQWQTALLAVRDVSGPVGEAGTTYVLDHGPVMRRHVRVFAAEPPTRHVIEQAGAGVRDQTVATFEREGDGTRLTLVTHARLNPLMRAAMLFDRGRVAREMQAELDRFAELATRQAPPARIGAVYVVQAGLFRRRVTVIGRTDGRVHVRVHPGHLERGDADEKVPSAPKPPGAQTNLQPIPPPVRPGGDGHLPGRGVAFLLRDGGHGVAHLALTEDAWADGQGRQVGDEPASADDHAAVEAWAERGRPTVGSDLDLDLTSLWTVRLTPHDSGESWAAVKMLRPELTRVHIALYAQRWRHPPESLRPWALTTTRISDEVASAAFLGGPFSIGHLPLTRAAWGQAQPRFGGVWTLERGELEGYETWKADGGGTLTTLVVAR